MGRPARISVRLRLDADVLKWFQSQGEDWEDRINAVLRNYMEGYRKGQEDALKWRAPETLPKQNGAEAILWLTTDKEFPDVSAHCYLKDGCWYWADSDEIIKRQDLIMGWLPWPEPPTD
jgi:hypothetical protein